MCKTFNNCSSKLENPLGFNFFQDIQKLFLDSINVQSIKVILELKICSRIQKMFQSFKKSSWTEKCSSESKNCSWLPKKCSKNLNFVPDKRCARHSKIVPRTSKLFLDSKDCSKHLKIVLWNWKLDLGFKKMFMVKKCSRHLKIVTGISKFFLDSKKSTKHVKIVLWIQKRSRHSKLFLD